MRVRALADELELPMTMHLNESRVGSLGRERSLARLEQLGLLSPLLAAVHMIQARRRRHRTRRRGGASVVHCPQSNLKLGSGVCPVPLFKDARRERRARHRRRRQQQRSQHARRDAQRRALAAACFRRRRRSTRTTGCKRRR